MMTSTTGNEEVANAVRSHVAGRHAGTGLLSPKRIAIIRHEVGVDCFRTSRGLEQMQSVGLYWGGPGTSPTQVCRLGSGPRRQAVSLRGPRCPLLTFRMNFGTAC